MRLRNSDMRGGSHADTRLDHAADHAFDLVHGGYVSDVYRARYAAGLHELDVDDIRGAHANEVDHLRRPEDAFVRHDWRVHAFGNVLHAFQIVGLHRLLDELHSHTC